MQRPARYSGRLLSKLGQGLSDFCALFFLEPLAQARALPQSAPHGRTDRDRALGQLFGKRFFFRGFGLDLSSESPREYHHRQIYTIHSSTMTPMTGPPSFSAGGPGASSSVSSSL